MQHLAGLGDGAQGRNRTTDTVIFSHAYRLSENFGGSRISTYYTKNINHINDFSMTPADTGRTLSDIQVN
jgi:hypothetical protein